MSSTELKSIIGDIVDRIVDLFKIKDVGDMVDKTIDESYDDGVFKAEKQFDMNLDGNKKNLELLKEHTFNNIKGMNEDTANKLRQVINQGVLNNKSIETIKQEVSKVMDVSEVRARAIARTETNRAENQGHLDGAKDTDLDLKKYISITKDDRTSPISIAMSEKYGDPEKAISLDENFSVVVGGRVFEGPFPPFHVNDRDVILFTQD